MTKIFLRMVIVMMVFSFSAFSRTPVETFIYHVKEGHDFAPVTNLWQPDNDFDKTALLTEYSKIQMLRMDMSQLATFMKQQNFAISLSLPGINGGSYTVELAKYDFRADDFTIHVAGGNGQGRDIHELEGIYYRGVVKDIPGSIAAFSFYNDQVYGLFSIPGVGNFVIGSYSTAGDVHYILYNSADMLHPENQPKCGSDLLQGANTLLSMARTTSKVGEKLLNSCKQVKVYELADYNTYQTKFSSLVLTTRYVAALFNSQSLIYKNEGVIISLKYMQIDTAADDYSGITSTNSTDWLNVFGDKTQDNMHGANVAIMLTTAAPHTMGGVAWLGTICSGYNSRNSSGPYAFCNVGGYVNPAIPTWPPTLNYFWDVEVTTHEMGHTLGSPHTHACYWNGNNTAIDGCYTLEGSCAMPVPQYPVGGGTIMSYCHLTSTGIAFANGFGPQPGDIIRAGGSYACDTPLYVPSIAVNLPNATFTANMECTDPNGITYYWNDSNTASQADDRLLMMVRKAGNDIGSIDSPGFSVTVSTLPAYASGTAQPTNFPTGTSYIGANTVAMNRYWKMAATKVPSVAVEVMFPFSNNDVSDIDGSTHFGVNLTNYNLYTVTSTIDPNPANNFPGATVSNIALYDYSTAATTNTWSYTTLNNMNVAHFKMTNLITGGGMYFTYGPTSVSNQNGVNAGMAIYPNPFSDHLSVMITNGKDASLTLFSTDGKLLQAQQLYSGTNTINIANMPTGMYIYRIVSSNEVYTGKLEKI